jgi:hypothetical protein
VGYLISLRLPIDQQYCPLGLRKSAHHLGSLIVSIGGMFGTACSIVRADALLWMLYGIT